MATARPDPCRPAVKRARSSLLWGLAGFVALQLGLGLAIERWLPEIRDPSYGYKADRLFRRVNEANAPGAPPPSLVLLLGSSRTLCDCSAHELEAVLGRERPVIAFNFGIPSAGPLVELLYLKRLLARGVRPDLVLIEILPPVLAGQEPAVCGANQFPAPRLWRRELPLARRYVCDRGLARAWYESWPVPWFTHRYALVSTVAPWLLPLAQRQDWFRCLNDDGSIPSPFPGMTAEQRRTAVEVARASYAPGLTNFHVGGPACAALRELLEVCGRERVPAALILLPEGSAFRSWYPPGAWRDIEGFAQALAGQMGVPLIDARTWMPDEAFADSHHLLPDGARAFTHQLGETALRPLLAAPQREIGSP